MKQEKFLKAFWALCVLVVGAGLLYMHFNGGLTVSPDIEHKAWFYLLVAAMAFFAEYVDSSLGMGYGTTLTPVLLIMGLLAKDVVPAILVSEFVTGISAGFLHHQAGNADLAKGTSARSNVRLISLCAIVGTIAAVLISVNLPAKFVKTYIGVMIVAVGLFLIFGQSLIKGYSRKRVVALGIIAAFNKGISGGGFGPLLTGGQVASGVKEKEAVAITSVVEGLVCLVGIVLYIILKGVPGLQLTAALTLGALLSVPASVWTVKVLPEKMLRASIGYATVFLGVFTLLKVL